MTISRPRLAWLATHPTQYQAPLLRAIAQSGIDLSVFFFSDFSTRKFVDKEFGEALTWDVPLLEGYRSEFLRASAGSEQTIGLFRPRIKGLRQRLTRERFDAVMIQGWNHYGYVVGAWYAKRAGLKLLLRCEAADHVQGSSGLTRMLRNRVVDFVLGRVDRCLAIGTRNRNFYLAHGVAQSRIGRMPYCVDNDYFRARSAATDAAMLRRELGLDADRPVVLYAGKLTARKHAVTLLKGYAELPQPRPYLLFVGDGEQRPELERLVRERQLSEVRFLGFQNQTKLPGFYALADIFALPSFNETWGLVVNEAMNAGCAILATDQVGSSEDLVQVGVNGLLVPPGDSAAITEALRDMLSDRRHVAMGQRSLDIIATWGIPENVSGLKEALE